MSTVTVGLEITFDLDDRHALLVKDVLIDRIGKTGSTTMLTDNIGIYDYNPDEMITSVEVK